MTKEEVLEWVKGAKYVDRGFIGPDGCGNFYSEEIFEKDGKLFKVPHFNHEVSTFWSREKKFYYDVVPVVKKERTEYYYEEE